jgi:hypothetical protein
MSFADASFTNVLLFEGDNDLRPVGHLIDLLHGKGSTEFYDEDPETPGDTIGLKEFGGYDKLRPRFPVLIRTSSSHSRIGIVADADDEPASRWQSLTDALQNVGEVDCPDDPPEDGWVGPVDLPDRTVTVGIWMMPDNGSPGEAEDFLLELIPDEDTLLPRARECLETALPEIPEDERPKESKALLRTWLAWQEEPGRPLGPAVTEDYFNLEKDLARRFVAWLRRLFPHLDAGA